ncbi:hypothetical protein VTN31DRAFT_1227 [Thermomyces dupontii]|uniref:uncharacterized protein n=1 Tax=Talaromyces thermophilus TaxID=28565 RepID=UPI00374219E1
MREPSAQEQTTTINNAPASVEVDTSYDNDSSYGDELSNIQAVIQCIADVRHRCLIIAMRMADDIINSAMGVRLASCLTIQDLQANQYSVAYLPPNDETENDRLDIFHELCLTLMHRKLYLAPIKNPQRVIDLGTGTGIWAIDFADQIPRPR